VNQPQERSFRRSRDGRGRGDGGQRGGPASERHAGAAALSAEDAKKIVAGDADALVRCAEKVSRDLKAGNVKKAQIRNIFTALMRIRQRYVDAPPEQVRQLKLMRPRLHYMVARQQRTEPLKHAFEALIRELPADGSPALALALDSTFDFAEAVVAYTADAK
jgi:CRISPR type III-A-associated protein Csm2